ncbi:MAG: (Fe-S)-binding protein, partial [Chromatiaceae bacterium]|nr:(Fe-S)-binding protein [Chromatiaceae bacterium]
GGKTGTAPALFRGCIALLTDQPLEAGALRLLARLGYPPVVPDEQGCCGAIHRHNGYPSDADQLVAVNTQAFAGRPVIGLASACVAELQEQGQVNAIEVCRFLLDHPWPVEARLQPLPLTVAVHEPCSHRNQLRDQGAVYALLRRIPELSVASLPGNDTCCGAAGTYLIEHPEFALALAAPKVDALQAIKPDYLVTTNTGCALHLAARLRSAGLKTEVLHPIQLIERQLII